MKNEIKEFKLIEDMCKLHPLVLNKKGKELYSCLKFLEVFLGITEDVISRWENIKRDYVSIYDEIFDELSYHCIECDGVLFYTDLITIHGILLFLMRFPSEKAEEYRTDMISLFKEEVTGDYKSKGIKVMWKN